jgi:general secretion pathway protein E
MLGQQQLQIKPVNFSAHNAALAARLLEQGDADEATIGRATTAAGREGARLEQMLMRLGLVEEDHLLDALCHILRVSRVDPAHADHDRPRIEQLTLPYLSANLVLPMRDAHGPALVLADPGNHALRHELAFLLNGPIRILAASSGQIRAALLPPDDATHSVSPGDVIARDTEQLRKTSADGPVIKFVQDMLATAVLKGASDLHVESIETGLTLRFRLNGVLVPQPVDRSLPAAAILSRLKVMADVNVAERRLPQDGRLQTMIAGRSIDFRFSSLPTQWGESIAVRVLDPKALRLGWDRLGFDPPIVSRLKTVIESPSGLFLVTGPTGSGKTTTLYTALSHLNSVSRKIITVEDPIEYDLLGVQQIQVHDEIGLSFARVLRSILRHDPNVILIGEIRDQETAAIAVRAAQVGRMVLSTLHTNSAAGAVNRLADLGVPDYLVRDVLRGVLAQELLLSPCGGCGGAGCVVCGGTGVGARRLRAELWER